MYRGNGLLIGIYAYSPKRKAVSFTRSRACFLFCVPGLQVSGLVAVAVCCSCGCFRTGFHVLLYILLLLYPVAVCCMVRILLSGLKYLAIWSCHLYLVRSDAVLFLLSGPVSCILVLLSVSLSGYSLTLSVLLSGYNLTSVPVPCSCILSPGPGSWSDAPALVPCSCSCSWVLFLGPAIHTSGLSLTNLIRWVFDNIYVSKKDNTMTKQEFYNRHEKDAYNTALRILKNRKGNERLWALHADDVKEERDMILAEWYMDYRVERV